MPLKGYKAHKALHQDTGSDEISVASLSGELADRQKSKTGDSTLGWTDEKLLKGAGAGNAPEEIDVPAAGGPTIVRKTANETVNNSAVLQNDDHLFLPVAANEVWNVEVLLIITSVGFNSDFKCGFSVPNGAAMYWAGHGGTAGASWRLASSTTNPDALLTAAGSQASGSAPGTYGFILKAIYIGGGTAGNLQFQWAQNTATAEDTKVLTNSCIIAHKVA